MYFDRICVRMAPMANMTKLQAAAVGPPAASFHALRMSDIQRSKHAEKRWSSTTDPAQKLENACMQCLLCGYAPAINSSMLWKSSDG